MGQLERPVVIFVIWGLLFIVGCSLLQLLWTAGTEIRDARKPKPVSLAEKVAAVWFDVAKAEREAFRPLADVIAEAERKAIAMHSPLAGDPHEVQVVANPVRTVEVTSLVGGGVSHVPAETTAQFTHCRPGTPCKHWHDHRDYRNYPSYSTQIEVTAFGDREPMYLHPGENVIRPAMTVLEADLRDRSKWLREELKSIADTAAAYGRAFTRDEGVLCERLIAELDDVDRRLAVCRRNTTSGPGKPSRQSRPQTGHTPDPG
jgi:hypothetical protein